MKHLSSEEIIEFIAIPEITPSSLSLVSEVITHIRSCPKCLAEVQAYQLVADELKRRNQDIEADLLANEVRRRRGENALVGLEK